jgi:hypothetical protein
MNYELHLIKWPQCDNVTRQLIFGLFQTHYVSTNTELKVSKNYHFLNPPTFCWRNIGMVPLEYGINNPFYTWPWVSVYCIATIARVDGAAPVTLLRNVKGTINSMQASLTRVKSRVVCRVLSIPEPSKWNHQFTLSLLMWLPRQSKKFWKCQVGKYFAKINIGYQIKPWQIREGQTYVGMLQKQVFLEHPNKRLVLLILSRL